MLADTTKFIGVNEKCLKGEMVERKQLVEKMILNSGRGQICAKKKVLLGFPFTPAQHLSFICPFFPSILSLYKAVNEWVHYFSENHPRWQTRCQENQSLLSFDDSSSGHEHHHSASRFRYTLPSCWIPGESVNSDSARSSSQSYCCARSRIITCNLGHLWQVLSLSFTAAQWHLHQCFFCLPMFSSYICFLQVEHDQVPPVRSRFAIWCCWTHQAHSLCDQSDVAGMQWKKRKCTTLSTWSAMCWE